MRESSTSMEELVTELIGVTVRISWAQIGQFVVVKYATLHTIRIANWCPSIHGLSYWRFIYWLSIILSQLAVVIEDVTNEVLTFVSDNIFLQIFSFPIC